MHWKQLSPHLFRFEDSCAVYAIIGEGGAVVVNAGTGAWLDRKSELPASVQAVFCTHHFRDHTQGAGRASREGIRIAAPYWERELFADARGHFARRETYIIYDNIWDLYGPIDDIPVDTWLMDWDRVRVAGVELTVVPTPGVTPGAVSLGAEVDGKLVLFCGELIHSPGKLARVAPLQYNYNDLPGALSLAASIEDVLSFGPAALAPSLGPEVIESPVAALSKLQDALRAMVAGRPGYVQALGAVSGDGIDRVTEHLYKSRHSVASSYFLISEDGAAMAIDYGYHGLVFQGAGYPFPRNRRSRLHGLSALHSELGIDGIDTVLVTHFHDDHVAGIPLLQRLYGTRCWAGENFASILENPEGYAFPCTWPEPIDVVAKPLETPIRWKEYEIVLHPMSGHTRFSTAIEIGVDGEKVLATGDQYFLQDHDPSGNAPAMHNHVYRNGATIDSFAESQRMLDAVSPTVVLPGHGDAYRFTESIRRRFADYSAQYESMHRRILPLHEPIFEVDGRAAWLEPYRTRLDSATEIEYTVHVRNPYPTDATLYLLAVAPTGDRSAEESIALAPRAEGETTIVLPLPAGHTCRRMPVALELRSDDRLFGRVAEALVTVGHPEF